MTLRQALEEREPIRGAKAKKRKELRIDAGLAERLDGLAEALDVSRAHLAEAVLLMGAVKYGGRIHEKYEYHSRERGRGK